MSDEWLRWVRDLGFPAAVALYVLIRLERRLEQIREALHDLKLCLLKSRAGSSS